MPATVNRGSESHFDLFRVWLDNSATQIVIINDDDDNRHKDTGATAKLFPSCFFKIIISDSRPSERSLLCVCAQHVSRDSSDVTKITKRGHGMVRVT